jgi:hypothetical protein
MSDAAGAAERDMAGAPERAGRYVKCPQADAESDGAQSVAGGSSRASASTRRSMSARVL